MRRAKSEKLKIKASSKGWLDLSPLTIDWWVLDVSDCSLQDMATYDLLAKTIDM